VEGGPFPGKIPFWADAGNFLRAVIKTAEPQTPTRIPFMFLVPFNGDLQQFTKSVHNQHKILITAEWVGEHLIVEGESPGRTEVLGPGCRMDGGDIRLGR
jgi:hypothetical protein